MNEIIIIGTIACDAAISLVNNKKDELLKTLSERFIYEAEIKLAKINSENEKIKNDVQYDFMLEASEYGIFGSLWDFAKARNTGIEIDLKQIPIEQETVEICEVFDINPYVSPSKGVYILSVDSSYDIIRYCKRNGICATVVGRETESNDRVIINGDEVRYLTPTDREDYFKDRLSL